MDAGETAFAQLVDFLPFTNFKNVFNDTRATTSSNTSLAGTNSSAWPFLN
jgi:hypothetical protein